MVYLGVEEDCKYVLKNGIGVFVGMDVFNGLNKEVYNF